MVQLLKHKNKGEHRYEKQGKTISTRKAGTSFTANQKKW